VSDPWCHTWHYQCHVARYCTTCEYSC